MPNYPNAANSTTVYSGVVNYLAKGDIGVCFQAETPGAPQASIEFALIEKPGEGIKTISVEGSFNGAPGAFEIDVQESNTDADVNYQVVGGGQITAVTANNTFRADLQLSGKFVRLNILSRTNAVGLLAKITRA